MSDASSVVRALLIYGLCLPLAIFLGYLLALPLDNSSRVIFGVLFGVLTFPILLRWHHVWLIASWNTTMLLFFMPGKPTFTLLMIAVSLTISILHHILNKRFKFLYVPSVAWPMFFMAAVIIYTAKLRGGIGMQITGAEAYGGKRYFLILAAVLGYFALTARRIPLPKVKLYVGLYYLGAVTSAIANLAGVLGPGLYFLFLIFPVDPNELSGPVETVSGPEQISRLAGMALAALAIASFVLAVYGIKGILQKNWRILLLLVCFGAMLFGGFRSNLILFALTFGILFYLEGMTTSHLMPALVLVGVLFAAFFVGFSDRLPLSVQRTVSFLPYLKLDPIVAADVKGSTDWRVEMWKEVIPDIPKYLILGKGYTFDPAEMEMIGAGMTLGENSAAGSALAGDYHSGPLSVIIPLGIFGVIAFFWFLGAGTKLLLRNYRYGDPALMQINRYLLAQFIAKTIFFFAVFGSLYSDLITFTGLLGLSVCVNGGMARKSAPAPAAKPGMQRLRLANANAVR
jgi:hypothetical protein